LRPRQSWCVLYKDVLFTLRAAQSSNPPRMYCSVPSRNLPRAPRRRSAPGAVAASPTQCIRGRIGQRDARDIAAMVQKQQFSGGMVQKQQFSAPRKQGSAWVLVGIAALAAVAGLMVAGTNAYLASDPWNLEPHWEPFTRPQGSLKHELDMGRAPVATVKLTPDLVRALLTLDEKDQLALVVDPKTDDEVARQREIIDRLVVDKKAEAPLPAKAQTGLAEDGIEEIETEHHHHREVHHLIEEHGSHELTPSQERAERLWALIFVTFIVTASVIFETCKEVILHNTPETMTVVVDKFFGELATLGFIGTLAFVFTTGFAGNVSILGLFFFCVFLSCKKSQWTVALNSTCILEHCF
jgi:hypothetical protein